jgi:hypothetical protein
MKFRSHVHRTKRYCIQRLGLYYRFTALSRPGRMRNSSSYVTFRFVLELRDEYERFINDLLRKDNRQSSLKKF